MDFATATEEASPYWVADLWNYAGSRHDWRDKIDAWHGGSHQTLLNKASIARRVTGEARDLAPSIRHADAVAKLDPDDQVEVLAQARDEGLTSSETRALVSRRLRPAVLESQARLEGRYRVIYADCPWSYQNDRPLASGALKRASESYEGMSIDDLCKLPVAAHALPDAVLFAWVTASHLYDNPGPREVIEAWGFTPKTSYVWDKVLGMPGHYSYVQHELLIVATRGSCTPDVTIQKHDHASLFTQRRQGEHSEKPECARRLIESLYTTGPYLELFARHPVEGWTAFGNDARLWGAA